VRSQASRSRTWTLSIPYDERSSFARLLEPCKGWHHPVRATASSFARSATRRGDAPLRAPRRARLRVVPTPARAPITGARLLASWRRSLDAASAGVDAAYRCGALGRGDLDELKRGLQLERRWLERFERDSHALFP